VGKTVGDSEFVYLAGTRNRERAWFGRRRSRGERRELPAEFY
jgi:hypothetical protein